MNSSAKRGSRIFLALLTGAVAHASAQTVTPGAREIWLLNFAGLPVGDFPKRPDLSTQSSLEVVDKDGVPMLKAGTRSEFLIRLPEVLPEAFTLEFDLVPKEDGSLEDLSFGNLKTGPAVVFWSPTTQSVGEFRATSNLGNTRGQLTKILASFESGTLKLYTNGVRLYTLTDLRFVRGQDLRVFLGGENDQKGAVFLARVRVAEGAATVEIIAQQSTSTGMLNPSPGSTIRPVGGTPATVATDPLVKAPSSTGAVAVDPVLTTQTAGRSSAILNPTLPAKTIILSGVTGKGTFELLAPKTITLYGFTGVGGVVTLTPQTITLQGWTAVGVPPAP